MNNQKNRLLPFLFILLLLTSGCRNSTQPNPNKDALFLEFSIVELPNTDFSIDQENRFIELTDFQTLGENVDLSSLTASFNTSEGATVLVDDEEQVPGETINDFTEGVFYTVVSEDELTQQIYFVYLTKELPLNYLLTDKPSVQINPSDRNPLSAQIEFETREISRVSIKVLGDIPVQKTFSNFTDQHAIPVLGLYADSHNQVVINVENPDQHTVTDTLFLTTAALPGYLPTPEINVLNEGLMEPGMHFNEVSIGNNGVFMSYPLIFDNNGDIRWIMDLSEANKIIWALHFNPDNTFYFTHSSSIFEYDMLGNEINQIVIDGYVTHHEVRKIPNGNYLVAVDKNGATMIKNGEEMPSVEDFIVEVNSVGSIVNEWDMAEILDVNRTDLIDGGRDWFHMNAIWYSEEDNSLIVSGRNQGLVKVNHNNELQWILAPHKGWGLAGRFEKSEDTKPYLLTAIDEAGNPYSYEIQQGTLESSDFSWSWGQHAPLILPNGNLFVFDNGFNRNFGNASSYSMGTEYKIDEENMTIQQVWSYGRQRGEELFANIISDVDYLPETNNRLFMPGVVNYGEDSYSKIVEMTHPANEIVFESTLYFKNALVNGQGWGNLDITYRAERVSLYRK